MKKQNLASILSIILVSGLICSLLISCSENKPGSKDPEKIIKQPVQKYDGVTIEFDISNKNCLSILLAADGTINRKGNSLFDPAENNFFMGMTDSGPFENLMGGMPEALLTYCGTRPPACDTLKQTCKAKIAFGNNTSTCEIEYCVNGTIDSLPDTIKDFIKKSVSLTEPWYQEQQKMLHHK